MKTTVPQVRLGQTVLWYDGGTKNDSPYPAIVTGVGEKSIALWILGPMAHNGMVRDGVRHISDPDRKAILQTDAGAWDHTADWYEDENYKELVADLCEAARKKKAG